MTTINVSVFAGLAGANQTLIARAVALINDQRLTTLEPLRQALNSGDFIVRYATDAEAARAPALYVDAVRDVHGNVITPGEIVLRAADLTRGGDPDVLKLIDNLNHEGAGHGNAANELNRQAAWADLINA